MKKRTTLELEPQTLKHLKMHCVTNDKTMKDFINEAINFYIGYQEAQACKNSSHIPNAETIQAIEGGLGENNY